MRWLKGVIAYTHAVFWFITHLRMVDTKICNLLEENRQLLKLCETLQQENESLKTMEMMDIYSVLKERDSLLAYCSQLKTREHQLANQLKSETRNLDQDFVGLIRNHLERCYKS